jgi:hypothetical protein
MTRLAPTLNRVGVEGIVVPLHKASIGDSIELTDRAVPVLAVKGDNITLYPCLHAEATGQPNYRGFALFTGLWP